MTMTPPPVTDIAGARVLAVLGDSVTTDHISPAGSIKANGPAGKYLTEHGVKPADFNSYGSRRGNHEVMVRGTFANVRLRNKLAPGTEGGVTRLLPEGEADVHLRRQRRVRQARQSRSSSSPARNTAPAPRATGPPRAPNSSASAPSSPKASSAFTAPTSSAWEFCLCNLQPARTAESLGLTGEEEYYFYGLTEMLKSKLANRRTLEVQAHTVIERHLKGVKKFNVTVRIDTPQEIEYFKHGGILQYVLRQLAAK